MRNLKDKVQSMDIAYFRGDINSMLHKIEDINSIILAEEKTSRIYSRYS